MNLASFDLNLLVAFDALMDERNVTRAGNKIGLSQPAMSAVLKRLRTVTQDELFERRGDGMRPTARAIELAGPIRQALLLVLVEAIRLAPGGEIVLEACTEPDQVTLTVRSLAPHPAPVRAQLDKLAVARQIAGLSGSQLETITGAGNTPFVAHLHLRAAAQATILFIEDNPDTLQLYQRYLAGTGYRFASAATDDQISAALAEVVPQAIVLDVMLSGMDGWEVLGRLRTHPRTQDVPVIMCSILPLEQLARNLGAAAFLQKPVSREALLAKLAGQREARGQKPCSAS